MKSSILSTLLMLSLGAALGPIRLMAQGPISFTIPFDFTVGSKSFAAGEYSVGKPVPGVVAIHSLDSRNGMAITVNRGGEPSKAPGIAKLTFNRYGDHYFLSQLSDNVSGWQFVKSAVEKELIAKRAEPKPLSVLASNAK